MKKILSLVLAMMMVLSMTTVAFAGTFEDVTDATTAKAVDALTTLKIVNGYADGTYRPGETVTRAEMAKLLVVALGNADIADGSKSSFADIKATDWFDGYAAVAQSLGISNGTGNGHFEGNRKITYTEVIVMAMRALGYDNRSVNTSRQDVYNPTAYKTAAAKIGLLKNVTVKIGDATRGDVAKIIYNALLCTMVNIDKDGNPIARTHIVGDANQPYKLINSVALAVSHTVMPRDLFGKHPADLTQYLGEEVVAYVADTDKANNINQRSILFVDSSSDSYYNRITSGSMANGARVTVDAVAGTINLNFGGGVSKTADYATARIIINNVIQDNDVDTANSIKAMAAARRVNSVKFIAASSNYDVDTIVIEDVNTTIFVNAPYVAGKAKFQGIDLPLDDDDKVDTTRMIFVGDASSLEDIEVNDVVQACTADGDNIKFYVTRSTIEGTVTEKSIDGETYYVDEVKYATNKNSGVINTLNLQAKGTFFLDKDKRIAYSDASIASTAKYAVIIGTVEDGSIVSRFGYTVNQYPQIKMVNEKGETKVYDLRTTIGKNDSKQTVVNVPTGFTVNGSNIVGGDRTVAVDINAGLVNLNTVANPEYLVKYTLDAAGRIRSIQAVTPGTSVVNGKKTEARFIADESTLILGRDQDGVYSLIELEKLTKDSITYKAVTNSSNFGWDFVVITDGLQSTNTVKTFAVILSTTDIYDAGYGNVSKITALVNGEKKTYVTTSRYATRLTTNEVYSLEFDAFGAIDTDNTGLAISLSNSYVVASQTTCSAITANGLRMKLSDNSYHTLSSNVVVYKESPYGDGYLTTLADLNDIRITDGTTQVSLYDMDTDGVIDLIFMHRQ